MRHGPGLIPHYHVRFTSSVRAGLVVWCERSERGSESLGLEAVTGQCAYATLTLPRTY